MRLEPVLHNKRREKPQLWEALEPQLERSPHSTQLEKSLHSDEDSVQSTLKINKNPTNMDAHT